MLGFTVRCGLRFGDVEQSRAMARAVMYRRILLDPKDIEARLVREIRSIRELENQDIPE